MRNKKFVTALMIVTAGSVFYGTVPAQAGGVELEEVDITFRRNHDDRYERHAPPRDMQPPPPHHYYEGRQEDFGRHARDFEPRPPRHGRHMPPPPPPHYHEPHWHGRRF